MVLGLREATSYGTKDTVAGYNGTKATQATTVNEVTKSYDGYDSVLWIREILRYTTYERYDSTNGYTTVWKTMTTTTVYVATRATMVHDSTNEYDGMKRYGRQRRYIIEW